MVLVSSGDSGKINRQNIQLFTTTSLSTWHISTFLVSAGILYSSPDKLSCRRDNYADGSPVMHALWWHIFYFIF